MCFTYPCFLRKNDDFGYTFECVQPSIFTDGDREEAISSMHEIMLDMICEVFRDKRPFALPDPEAVREGERIDIKLTANESLKLLLVNAMFETRTRPIDIANKLGIARQAVTLIINPRRRTDVETIVKAIEACGKKVTFSVS